MAGSTSPVFAAVPHNAGLQFTSSDTTTKKTLYTPGANGSRVESIFCSTNDTTAIVLNFYINDGSTDFYVGDVTVPIGSGYTTVARVDAITILASLTLACLLLPSGHTLKVSCNATMTSAKTLDIYAMGADF